jgi:hypothetical protein
VVGKTKADKAIDAAIKSGDWDKAPPAAKAALEKAGAKLSAAREVKPREPEQLWKDGLPQNAPDPEPDDTPPEEVVESVDPDLALDDIEQDQPRRTLRDAYEAYKAGGGNRFIREDLLQCFDGMEVESIDRKAQREAAEKVFPGPGEDLWQDEVFDPIAEVLRFGRKRSKLPWSAANGYIDSGHRYSGFRNAMEPPPFAPGLRVRRHLRSLGLGPEKWAAEQPKGPPPCVLKEAWEQNHPPRPRADAAADRRDFDTWDRDDEHRFYSHDWPLPDELQKRTTNAEWESYRARQLAQICRRYDGLEFGMPPRVPVRKSGLKTNKGTPKAQLRQEADAAMDQRCVIYHETYYGFDPSQKRKPGRPRSNLIQLKRPVGRPPLGKERMTPAEKQRRYRLRKEQRSRVLLLTPRLQKWMQRNLRAETLALFNLRKAA